jgi:hypothetical protein
MWSSAIPQTGTICLFRLPSQHLQWPTYICLSTAAELTDPNSSSQEAVWSRHLWAAWSGQLLSQKPSALLQCKGICCAVPAQKVGSVTAFLLIMFTTTIYIIYSKWASSTTRYLQNVCTVLRNNKVFTKYVHSTQAQQDIYKMCAQYSPRLEAWINSSSTACKVQTHKTKINFPLLPML